jgi:hypothetical protein
MTWFFHSLAFPGTMSAVALGLALWSGRVIDMRRGSYSGGWATFWLKKSDSPVYYWFVVGVLAFLVALCLDNLIWLHISN